jgi:predicted cytidylate kinase
MIISISGKPGAGKTTVAKMLAKKLGFKFYSIGDLRGEIAMKLGITIDELNEIGTKQEWTDKNVDEYQKELGEKEDNFVIDSWLGFHFIPKSKKIFLDVDPKEAAKRIFKDQRKDEPKMRNVEEVEKMLEKRVKNSLERYKKYYNINCFDKKNYDLVIDTTHMKPEDVVKRIMKFLKI